MSKLQYFNYPGWGDMAKEKFHYAQAVRVGNEIKIAGQGGWNDEGGIPESEDEQITLALQNIEKALKHAGIKKPFENVYSIRSYHVGLRDDLAARMADQIRKVMPTHQPIWTLLGVERLALPEMKVEIEVVAVVDDA